MSEQFHILFEEEHDACEAEKRLRSLKLADRPMLYVGRNGKAVFSGCAISDELPENAVMTLTETDKSCPFFKIFYKVEGMKSGMHHPDGMLWVRGPERKHRDHPEKASLTIIAPMILKMFGLQNGTDSHAARPVNARPEPSSSRSISHG